jgi:hypothetical protein
MKQGLKDWRKGRALGRRLPKAARPDSIVAIGSRIMRLGLLSAAC